MVCMALQVCVIKYQCVETIDVENEPSQWFADWNTADFLFTQIDFGQINDRFVGSMVLAGFFEFAIRFQKRKHEHNDQEYFPHNEFIRQTQFDEWVSNKLGGNLVNQFLIVLYLPRFKFFGV